MTYKPCLPAFLTVHCVVRMKCFAVSVIGEDPSKLRGQISSCDNDNTVIEVPLTTISKIHGRFQDVYNINTKEDVAAFVKCIDTNSFRANGEKPAYNILELQELYEEMKASPTKMKNQALTDLTDVMSPTLTLSQHTGSDRRASKRCKGVSASPGKTDEQARMEGKAKKTPRWKAIEELINDIEIQRQSNKLINGVFCEGGKVTPPTLTPCYVRTPKPKQPVKSAKVASKRSAPASILKTAEKRLKAARQREEDAAVVELKKVIAEKISDQDKLKRQLAEAEDKIVAYRKRAEEAEYKLAAEKANHELVVRAVRAEVQVEMLTRPPNQPSSNARSRSDSPAGQYMSMDLNY